MKKYCLIGTVIFYLFLPSTAHATVWYVHPDSILNSIQAGIDSTSTGDTVLVGPGIYYENLVWPNVQSIKLISEYGPDTTIIDGSGTDRVLMINIGIDTATVINGFTIQNGSALSGGGILCYDNSSPSITNNTITGNTGNAGGGGILVYEYCSPTISDNTITYNTADGGGGLVLQTTSSLVTGNTISGNTAGFGGGIHCTVDDSSTITGNTITGNTAITGGGISCKFDASPIIEHCTIAGNHGDGIYCFEDANPIINYNDIVDNVGYGIRNISSITVNAEHNWWGDSTGPYHPTTNPGGLGDTVSDYVDFGPWLTGIEEYETSKPVSIFLQISPNPFRKLTKITFGNVQRAQGIELKIFDATGRLVKDFSLPTAYSILPTAVSWDGTDSSNRKLPSGVYFLNFRADDCSAAEKLLLIR